MEIKNKIKIDGRPYVVQELDSGLFAVIKEIASLGADSLWCLNGKERLKEGIDLTEVPNSIKLSIEFPKEGNPGIYLINGLKDLGKLCGCDYVGYQKFGEYPVERIFGDGSMSFQIVSPRLFRKVIDG